MTNKQYHCVCHWVRMGWSDTTACMALGVDLVAYKRRRFAGRYQRTIKRDAEYIRHMSRADVLNSMAH